MSGIESGWSQSSDRTTTYTITGIAFNDVLNVRSGPGMNFPIVAKLSDGDGGVRITGESVVNGDDDWVPIQFPGGKGWTRPKFLTSLPSGITVQQASGIQRKVYRVAGIDPADTLNVRAGPGVNYSIVDKVFNGKRGLRITGASVKNGPDDWVPIDYDDKRGWIRPIYLVAESDSPKLNEPNPLPTNPAVVKEPTSEAVSQASSLQFKFDGDLIPQWTSTVPKSIGTYQGRSITISLVRSDGKYEQPQAKDIALLDAVLLNLPKALTAAEKVITNFNKEAESNFVERPHILITGPGMWMFTVYEKDDDEGLNLMFSGADFVEIAEPLF